jgi:alpha-galactosidase
LADFLHEKGLKLGLSAGAGTKTCSEMVGIQGHEQQDAQLFASWGIDAITFDYCYH